MSEFSRGDPVDRLCRALYGRDPKPIDYLGGAQAKMIADAANRLELLGGNVANKYLRNAMAELLSWYYARSPEFRKRARPKLWDKARLALQDYDRAALRRKDRK